MFSSNKFLPHPNYCLSGIWKSSFERLPSPLHRTRHTVLWGTCIKYSYSSCVLFVCDMTVYRMSQDISKLKFVVIRDICLTPHDSPLKAINNDWVRKSWKTKMASITKSFNERSSVAAMHGESNCTLSMHYFWSHFQYTFLHRRAQPIALGTVHNLRDPLGGGVGQGMVYRRLQGGGGLAAGHVVIFYCDFILNIYLQAIPWKQLKSALPKWFIFLCFFFNREFYHFLKVNKLIMTFCKCWLILPIFNLN